MAQIISSPEGLGAALRVQREAQGLSQSVVGSRTGMRQATISTFEAAGNGNVVTLFAILGALNLDLAVIPRGDAAKPVARAIGDDQRTVRGAADSPRALNIPDAKKAIAITVGVPESAIEITIRA